MIWYFGLFASLTHSFSFACFLTYTYIDEVCRWLSGADWNFLFFPLLQRLFYSFLSTTIIFSYNVCEYVCAFLKSCDSNWLASPPPSECISKSIERERGKMELRNSYLKSSEQHSFFKMEGFSYCIKNFRCVTSLFFKRAQKKEQQTRNQVKQSSPCAHKYRMIFLYILIQTFSRAQLANIINTFQQRERKSRRRREMGRKK